MRQLTRTTSLLALAAAAVAASPAGAPAQAPSPPKAPYVVEPITTTPTQAYPSIGNGVTAWATPDIDLQSGGSTVWTLRDGKPVVAGKLPVPVYRLEAGTDADDHPVAIISPFPQKGKAMAFYLVRLDTGKVSLLRLGGHASRATSVAIDGGRIVFSTAPRRSSSRERSYVYIARLRGSGVTEKRRVRRARRGVAFTTVVADRHRIAATGARARKDEDFAPDFDLPLYAGTARGSWRKIDTGSAGGGGLFEVTAEGFTASRRSIITTTNGPVAVAEAERVSLRTGRKHKLTLENPDSEAHIEAAYEPTSNRLLLSSSANPPGSAATGGFVLGWTNVLT